MRPDVDTENVNLKIYQVYYVNLRNVLREAFNEKKSVEIFQLFHSRSQLGLLSDLDAHGCCTYSDDLILIVLKES